MRRYNVDLTVKVRFVVDADDKLLAYAEAETAWCDENWHVPFDEAWILSSKVASIPPVTAE
jgi:hypothetical protein